MRGTACEAAFVSTNSICQGQQVQPLWEPLFDMGIKINFAHRTFTWSNEANDQAHVFCIIVGFSYQRSGNKELWTYRRATSDERADGQPREIGQLSHAKNINGYLADAPNVFIERRNKPLSDVSPMIRGNQPTDGGNLLLSSAEKTSVLAVEPSLAQFIRPFSMGHEFINGKERFCFWLVDAPRTVIANSPILRDRVEAVRQMRLASSKEATRKKADTPWLFDEIRYSGVGTYIGVPKVSSQRRRYVPMGLMDDGMIPGDMLYFIPTDSLYIFGMVLSQFHNAFMRAVAGRLKSDYRYANTIVYNNFVFPDPTDEQRQNIERCAQAVLDARALYPDATLTDLYDPDNTFLYPELVAAHTALDSTVEAAYGVDFSGLDDDKREAAIVAHLFELYSDAVRDSK